MPKNKIGGKNFKKGKKGAGLETERSLLQKTEGQAYALVTKLNGNSMINCKVFSDPDSSGNINGRDVVGIIRPGLKKKRIFINANNTILVCLRDFEPGKVDVVYSYKLPEVKKLFKMGQIPDVCLTTTVDEGDGDPGDKTMFSYIDSQDENSDESGDGETETVVKRGKTVKKKKVDNTQPYLQLPDDFCPSLSEEEEVEYGDYDTSKKNKSNDIDIDNI